jgi:uncharacterized protein YbjT (DUF2867 family)
MSLRKILAVFGATGNQGGSVINSVLAHPKLSQEFSIRAITRDVTKPSSVALKEKGVEVVAVCYILLYNIYMKTRLTKNRPI